MARNKFDIDENLDSPFSIKQFARSFEYILHYKGKMLIALGASALATVLGLFGPVFTQRVIDVYIPHKNIRTILLLSGLYAVLLFAGVLLGVLRSRIMTVVSQHIIYEIRRDMFAHLQKLPFSYYDSRPHGKILVRVVNYVNSVSDILSNGVINLVLEISNVIFILIFMLMMNVPLTIVVLCGMPFLMIFVAAIKSTQRRRWRLYSNKSSNLNAYIHESLAGMRVTQAFTREKFNRGIFMNVCNAARKTWMRCIRIIFMMPVCTEIISISVYCAVYFLGLEVFTGISVGVVISMGGYAWRFWTPIQNLGNIYNSFVNAVAYLERIFELMDEPVLVSDAADAKELPAIEGKVTFDRVNFGYDKDVKVLSGVSFEAAPGESIALVGATGSGKTTIVNLISRFYNVSDGALLIDGENINGVTLASLRRQMGIMLQDSFIFSGTIMENIKYGRLDATDEEAVEAAKIVRAHDFISGMKNGYDTELSERGTQLSAGQKQLVAFARTLLADPRILVLDEATSAIDTYTEVLLQEGLRALLKGRTSFIVAHRLSTIKSCDRIMYISKGEIAEIGSHESLMELRGNYYNLYISQM